MSGKENAAGSAGGGAPAARAFSPTELKGMLGQCLKMASENKITPQNTWALPLIEHLPELIREEGGAQTNFQRASVTLDAGVKIYSYRVDSVHTETFKILGGLGRASKDDDDDDVDAGELGDGGGDGDGEEGGRRRRRQHELNPEATLESSLEALNVKKFDLAFTVDPLFHKTSAQFDEGGAKGLLLNNLSVYRGCEIVFDSMDVPESALDDVQHGDALATVNLGSLQQQLAALQLQTGTERISPTLDHILELLDEAPAEGAAAEADEFVRQVAETGGAPGCAALPPAAGGQDDEEAGGADAGEASMEGVVAEYAYEAPLPLGDADDYDDGGADYGGGDDFSDDGQDGGFAPPDHGAADGAEAGAAAQAHHPHHAAPLGEDAIQWLIEAGSNDAATRAKGWAGASHWRYRAVQQPAGEGEGEEGGGRAKKRTTRRKNDPIDFVALMEAADAEVPTFDMLPTKARARRAKPPAKTLLPEDHHYKVENLNRYALRPRNAVVAASEATGGNGAAGGAAGAEGDAQPAFNDADGFDDFGGGGGDDDDDDLGGDAYDGGWGDGAGVLGGEDGEGLEMVEAARRVEKVEVNYSRAAKQVDVRSLKELMWRGIHATPGGPPSPDAVLQFQDVLLTVPERNGAGRLEDLSVHLCFICVLHLANEHGLVINSVPELDRLLISNVPAAESPAQH
ncbi:condensin complex subunit 2 [Micractinium conductrix]|uniref:Condensin complex subunit 2 n=1 Tax=Micractinium conductrix TaxID=554055 RepID=A0A2P6VP22_9CHLO|nr:condensin complex subunit 2 [Micractinium conductrix]|eukprot:PSC75846.1 condensin complex subunit 2 [Micractinium conductrix]